MSCQLAWRGGLDPGAEPPRFALRKAHSTRTPFIGDDEGRKSRDERDDGAAYKAQQRLRKRDVPEEAREAARGLRVRLWCEHAAQPRLQTRPNAAPLLLQRVSGLQESAATARPRERYALGAAGAALSQARAAPQDFFAESLLCGSSHPFGNHAAHGLVRSAAPSCGQRAVTRA